MNFGSILPIVVFTYLGTMMFIGLFLLIATVKRHLSEEESYLRQKKGEPDDLITATMVSILWPLALIILLKMVCRSAMRR